MDYRIEVFTNLSDDEDEEDDDDEAFYPSIRRPTILSADSGVSSEHPHW